MWWCGARPAPTAIRSRSRLPSTPSSARTFTLGLLDALRHPRGEGDRIRATRPHSPYAGLGTPPPRDSRRHAGPSLGVGHAPGSQVGFMQEPIPDARGTWETYISQDG